MAPLTRQQLLPVLGSLHWGQTCRSKVLVASLALSATMTGCAGSASKPAPAVASRPAPAAEAPASLSLPAPPKPVTKQARQPRTAVETSPARRDSAAGDSASAPPSPESRPSATAPVTETPASTEIHTLAVSSDRNLEVVFGPKTSTTAFIYMHGMCGNPMAFESWTTAASRLGSFIAMRGDKACDGRRSRSKWSYDMRKLDRRIKRALETVNRARSDRDAAVELLSPQNVVLIGYSQGAHIVQWMANYAPKRYRRLVMIAPAKAPQALRLRGASHIMLMAGSLDARHHIREGHRAVRRAGLNAQYVELPGARHGEYGPNALEVMSRALDWVTEGM